MEQPVRVPADGWAINTRGLGVRYSLRFTRKTSMRGTLNNLLRRRSSATDFWALRDVTFRVEHGEVLAVIGPNGAGKSTLLQCLAGIITPDVGVVEVRGRVSTLMSLSVGFDSQLTGVENILLAGAFLGHSHEWMMARLDDIIEFADLGPFIDAPLKTYSSGMRARLGFSIATAVDPDILLIDEVLGTGDQTFRAKSKERIVEMVGAAKAIVIVTHDLGWVTEFCNRALLLDRGEIVAEGAPADLVELYRERSARPKSKRERRAERLLEARRGSEVGVGR
jgi:ABC-type polysaccharide/polyol phosphate transport system ATPase subunit